LLNLPQAMDYQARSILETPYGDITSKYAYVSLRDYNKWFDDHPGGLMVLRLESQTGLVRYVAVASPYNSTIECNDDIIYLPYSIYQEFEHSNSRAVAMYNQQFEHSNSRAVAMYNQQNLPVEHAGSIILKANVVYDLEKATKIVLKPLDNAAYHQDMRELMESAMNEFPLLQKHTQFSVVVESLGGYMIDIWVEDIEPAEVVQLGGEVEVEFTEPLEEVVEFVAPVAAALPEPEPEPAASFQGMYFPGMTSAAVQPATPITLPTVAEKDTMRAARLARFNCHNKVDQ